MTVMIGKKFSSPSMEGENTKTYVIEFDFLFNSLNKKLAFKLFIS